MAYLDVLSVKVRDGVRVASRVAHIALGVDMHGVRHVLGIWVRPAREVLASECSQRANCVQMYVLIDCL